MRLLREFFRPALKCARLGHQPCRELRETIRQPEARYASVADQCEESRTACARCGAGLSEWQVDDRTWLQGLTSSHEQARRLRRDGFYVTRGPRRAPTPKDAEEFGT